VLKGHKEDKVLKEIKALKVLKEV